MKIVFECENSFCHLFPFVNVCTMHLLDINAYEDFLCIKKITSLFALCKGGNFNIHIWVWFGYFIGLGREFKFYL